MIAVSQGLFLKWLTNVGWMYEVTNAKVNTDECLVSNNTTKIKVSGRQSVKFDEKILYGEQRNNLF